MFSTKIRIALFIAVMVQVAVSFAASTKEIDEVRKKTTFTDADMTVIDNFINQAFTEMLEAPTIADSVKSREDILVRKPKDEQSKYRQQYVKTLETNINTAMRAMSSWNDEDFIKATRLNIAVIIGSIDDIGLYEIALTMMNENSPAVRYWALKALTGNNVRNSVRQNASSESSKAIIAELKKTAQKDSPIMLEMIAGFAVAINGQDAYELLASVASTRIEAYKLRAADHESTDGKIMATMAAKMVADAGSKKVLASPFANLMAYTLAKYSLDLSPDGGLGDMSQQQLITVIAELEKNTLPKLGITAGLTKAAERKSIKDFTQEYSTLFGTDGKNGALGQKLGVDITVEKLLAQ